MGEMTRWETLFILHQRMEKIFSNVQLLKVSAFYPSGTLHTFSGISREEAFIGASSCRFIFTE